MNKPEIIEIGGENLKSSNFGGGIELLMNTDKKNASSSNKNNSLDFEHLNDLDTLNSSYILEKELDLSIYFVGK